MTDPPGHAAVELPEGSWWDWDVIAWQPGEFRLAAGHDLTYHHGLEPVFTDPLLVTCPAGDTPRGCGARGDRDDPASSGPPPD